jgi:dTDP-4-amino-4,6-dideoxygalactose transaminase
MYRIGEEEVEALRRVIASKVLFRRGNPATGHQQEVEKFEREWAQKIGTEYSLLLSGGGTAALICALAALGIGPGDEVLVPAYTWMASATAVLSCGAIPVLCEVDETLAMDPHDVEKKLTPNVRAIIPVHMVGRPADLDSLLSIAREKNLYVVEDACQCDGGSYKGKRVGSYGDIGTFSFNDFKIISCGEGGAIVTDNREWFDRARVFHDSLSTFPNCGVEDLSIPAFVGLQFRASEVMGAILRVQLQRLDGILNDLRRVGKRFDEELADVPNLKPAPSNDPAGDCRVVTAFQFGDEKTARAFATSEGVSGYLPVDTGRHLYSNWDALIEGRIGHHPEMNPLNFPSNATLRRTFSPESCPRTRDLTSRTVFIANNPDWTDEQVSDKIAACRKAAENL